MGALHSAVLYLEERSSDDSTANYACIIRPCVKVLLKHTLADRLSKNPMFRLFGASPLYTFLGILVLYCVFVLLYYPFYGIGFIITPTGSFLLFWIGILLLCRWFARCLTFPGHTPYLQRQISQEYLKAFTAHMDMFHASAAEVFYAVLIVLNGAPREANQKKIQFRMKEMQSLSSSSMPLMLTNLECLIEASQEAPTVFSVSEMATLEDMKDALIVLLAQIKIVNTSAVGSALKALSSYSETTYIQLDQCLKGMTGDKAAITPVAAAFDATVKLKQVLNRFVVTDSTPSGPLATAKNSIATLYTRPVGFERVAFPMMRLSIGNQYSSTRFAVFGPENNKIDCMFISVGSRASPLDGVVETGLGGCSRDCFVEATAGSSDPMSLPLRAGGAGVVLYCNPNAGFYESLSLVPRNSSYVGMYLDMGYDVVVYNYRGYANSEGTPTPDRLVKDGCAIGKCIIRCINNRISSPSETSGGQGYTKFIVHGQSLGGMVACHVAAASPAGSVSLLVCDRTFASLDSVAGRMLGNWAGTALRQLACWRTNSVAAFLNAKCAKIIMQDPNDEIIYHSASLKCGIATYLALKDNLWRTQTFDRKFLIAAYCGSTIPFENVTSVADALLDRGEAQVSCIDRVYDYIFGQVAPSTEDNAESIAYSLGSAIRLIRGGLSSVSRCSGELQIPFNTRNPILTESLVQHLAACMLDIHSKTTRATKNKKSATKDKDTDEEHKGLDSASVAFDNAVREAADDLWNILAKIGSDGCGQLLGHAIAKGYDEIRSWICCFIVWSHLSLHDPQLPSISISIETGIYAIKASLSRFADKCDKEGNLAGDPFQREEFVKVAKFLLDGMETMVSLNAKHTDLLSEYEDVNTVHTAKGVSTVNPVKYARSEAHPTCGTNTLLPLHCGHNGFPTPLEVGMLSALIKQKLSVSRGSY